MLSGPDASPKPVRRLVFVTVTPTPTLALSEGSRAAPVSPIPTPVPAPYFAAANELGKVMVLQYHRIAYPEQRFQRSPANFRADLQRLYNEGYYPVNFIDLVDGLPNVPAGKRPVVITFDDSDISQFTVRDPGIIDGDSGVGILMNFHYEHPTDWPARATFFILGNDTNDYRSIFGQPKWVKAKLHFLVEQGMEIGSHTVNHTDLSTVTAERIHWELAVSKQVLESLVSGYTVRSLAAPYGGFPFKADFLQSGEWGDLTYRYDANAAAWGGPSPSPFDPAFDPYRVPRIEVSSLWLDYWLTYFQQNPDEYYISDGDPNRITAPTPPAIAAEQSD
ncbi:MAG: hypothetical protein D6784_16185 [Chloroflexi bacterium]|nr:MAG: hypothetical protein D6784_16185 [Chloroflexota bacterium]